MSHIAEIAVEVRDTEALKIACRRCGAEFIGAGVHNVYTSNVDGVAVKLKDWTFPVVFTAAGKVAYDNYNGAWGNVAGLNKLRQMYAVEVAKKAAKRQGMSVTERQKADGSIQLVCQGRK